MHYVDCTRQYRIWKKNPRYKFQFYYLHMYNFSESLFSFVSGKKEGKHLFWSIILRNKWDIIDKDLA